MSVIAEKTVLVCPLEYEIKASMYSLLSYNSNKTIEKFMTLIPMRN